MSRHEAYLTALTHSIFSDSEWVLLNGDFYDVFPPRPYYPRWYVCGKAFPF